MAALMRHGGLMKRPPSGAFAPLHPLPFATKAEKKKGIDKKQPPKINASQQSLAAKGFLRPYDPYTPPNDVNTKLDTIFEKVLGATEGDTNILNLAQKFDLCMACAKEFDRAIPNSVLHSIQTLNDVRNFYQTPVDNVTPLDKMRNMDLPENLHVQYEYHRFHPETDKLFKGQTAYNRESTLVTGLKYKDKYKGFIERQEWPFTS
ncbi:39S ribosomal protein L50, mitochondrial [Tribolium madens]|uniref:39S ribosomal protein L50, mitochondrial n=1 Tax=Tribolium madens TaxID=41895 RepID=UPI001CF74B50|nr:39S ribosomal protein L50, mitochondrial [Tribolium madens]